MKHLFLTFFLVTFLFSCKKDDEEIEPTTVYIKSVIATPTSSESITIKNNTGNTEIIEDWTLGDENDPTAYKFPANTTLLNQELMTIQKSTFGFQINDSGETLYLKDETGTTIHTWSN